MNDGIQISTVNPGSLDAIFWNREEGYLSLGTNQEHRLLVSSDGDVGIGTGTADPQAKLQVAGEIVLEDWIGTLGSTPLDIRVNGQRALRLEPHATCPNLIGGSNANAVVTGVYGATIAGGGTAGALNRVADHGGTVAGGVANRAGDVDLRDYAAFQLAFPR